MILGSISIYIKENTKMLTGKHFLCQLQDKNSLLQVSIYLKTYDIVSRDYPLVLKNEKKPAYLYRTKYPKLGSNRIFNI